jgi:hypothetical protein
MLAQEAEMNNTTLDTVVVVAGVFAPAGLRRTRVPNIR